MKKIIILSLVLMLLVVGCGEKQDPDAPPNPAAPGGRTAIAGQAYAADGVCYTDEQLGNLFAENPDMIGAEVDGIEHEDWINQQMRIGDEMDFLTSDVQWVYSEGYILKNCDEWIQFDYTPTKDAEFFRDTPWIRTPDAIWVPGENTAGTSAFESSGGDGVSRRVRGQPILIDDSYSTEGPQYVATFACNREVDGWDCNDGKWVMVEFSVAPRSVGADDLCLDGVQNQDETDVDCGGTCIPCSDGMACSVDDDCNGFCDDGQCLTLVDVEGLDGDLPAPEAPADTQAPADAEPEESCPDEYGSFCLEDDILYCWNTVGLANYSISCEGGTCSWDGSQASC